jgi:V8-like Glu-specific endopeptidase
LEINEYSYEIIHKASTESGSSGSPIFLDNKYKLIGIHAAGFINKEEINNNKNKGYILEPIINSLKNNFDFGIKYYNNRKYKGEL